MHVAVNGFFIICLHCEYSCLKKNPNEQKNNKWNSWEEIVSDFCLQSYEISPEHFGKEKFKGDSGCFCSYTIYTINDSQSLMLSLFSLKMPLASGWARKGFQALHFFILLFEGSILLLSIKCLKLYFNSNTTS